MFCREPPVGPVFARAEMGPFFKGWIPADFHKTQIAHSTIKTKKTRKTRKY
jgi:hypothetical protein